MFFISSGLFGLAVSGLWFWIFLLFALVFLWLLFRQRRGVAVEPPEPRMLYPEEQPEVVREVMRVRIATEEDHIQIFRGRLLEPPSSAFDKLKAAFEGRAMPLLQEDEKLGSAIYLMPALAAAEKPVRPWVPWLLFFLTVMTTTMAGAGHQGVNLVEEPHRFVIGLPYSLGLLAILGFHEFGHYFTARSHRMRVTPPYFIPVPFLLGTFGAFIQMRSPPENRRALFDVAIAGPLAGLIIAIPALAIGLNQSTFLPEGITAGAASFLNPSPTSSILLGLLSWGAAGVDLTSGYIIEMSPLAFAGWLGLLVTALNLIPIGQLDGGHIARGMFGSRTGFAVSQIAMWVLFLFALFIRPELLFWAVIVFFIAAGRGAPPLNDLSPISRPRIALGLAGYAILASILLPVPKPWLAWMN